MGTGQMMLTIVGMMLLGNIILTANRGINNIQQTMMTSGYDIDAISLAKSTIDRAQDLAFDEKTSDSTWVGSLANLTLPTNLGQENGNANDLDDYDDFNGLSHGGKYYRVEIDTIKQTGFIYKDSTTVKYVTRRLSDGALIPSSATATWTKQLDVWVYLWGFNSGKIVDPGVYRPDTVHMVDIFSYWY